MDSLIGKTLSHYRIVEKIGAGGMGEVYRAHDSRLGRDVAIKVLPESFASDPDRLARFEREAKVLASLNHPNVAGIYGVEEAGGRRYLALEYVEGETLAARLARGALPLEEAIEICLQIATGMEAAHEKGIVHRDLKPGNVMITPGDHVKVVDFGLAKGKVVERGAMSPESPTMTESPALHHSPTMGTPATVPGVILGTAAYLSPEQARGKAVDRRTDIWSFGCVLYECLTGRRAFEGETISDLVATILKGDVEWSRLPKGTPARLHELLQHCLEKDPRKRLRDMGDARLALEDIREGKFADESAPKPRVLSPLTVAIALLLLFAGAAAGVAVWNSVGPAHRVRSTPLGVTRTVLDIPPDIEAVAGKLSPDGRFLIVVGRPRQKEGGSPSSFRLYRRRIDSFRLLPIEGSTGSSIFRFSPDGTWLYFIKGGADLRLMKTLLDGSAAPVAVLDWDPSWDPESWAPLSSGEVLIGTYGGAAYVRLPAGGGSPSTPIRFDPSGQGRTHFIRIALPGDRGVLLNTTHYEGGRYQQGISVLDLRSGKSKLLIRDGGNAAYSRTGHLVFTRKNTLLGVPFDLKALEVRSEPVALAEGLRTAAATSHALFSLSENGTLVYRFGGIVGASRRMIVADERGRVVDWTPDRAVFDVGPSASPDGARVAETITNAKGLDEIWISERGEASKRRFIALERAECWGAVWSSDGKSIAYARRGYDEGDGVYTQSLDRGVPRMICRSPDVAFRYFPTSWLPGGKDLLAFTIGEGGGDIVKIDTNPAADSLPRPVPLLSGPATQGGAVYSPDGRWVAFDSDETGRFEVYIAPYRPDASLGTPFSVGSGFSPRWDRSGRKVFFQREQGQERRVMSVALRFEPVFSASAPIPCWDLDSLRDAGLGWDILPGDRLITIQRGEDEDETDVTRLACVSDFFDELMQKMREVGKR